MCRCPAHEDATPSLSVRVGEVSILFKCFAGCATIDVLRALRDHKVAIPISRRPQRWSGQNNADALMVARAESIWREAGPLAGSLGERYLRARGIVRLSTALRFCPRTPIGRGHAVRFRPALIAAIRLHDRIAAIQRIFLSDDPPSLAADMARARFTLGRPLGGAVMLDRAGPVLGLAEGIETALSATILLGIPVWATLGNERLPAISLPSTVLRIVLLPDADAPGRLAERRARLAYARAGREIRTLWPWHGLNDWNDVLQREGERAEGLVRRAA